MLFADLIPTIEGRAFFCLDRLAPPDELVTAEQAVPGLPRLWLVRDPRGRRFVCPLWCLCDVPPGHLYRALRESAA